MVVYCTSIGNICININTIYLLGINFAVATFFMYVPQALHDVVGWKKISMGSLRVVKLTLTALTETMYAGVTLYTMYSKGSVTTIDHITYYFYIRLSECLIVHRCACTTGNRSISGYSCHIPTNSHHLLTAHTTHHLQVPVPAQKKEWQVETSCCCLWSCVII